MRVAAVVAAPHFGSLPLRTQKNARSFHRSVGRHLASPFTAWLRVPLSWFHSSTFAFFPDETHRSIRRTFISPFDRSNHRQFCGYCGTQLSQWNDSTRQDEEFISLTLGSLLNEDLERLGELGLLDPGDEDSQEAQETPKVERTATQFRPARGAAHRGAPWFEELVEDSRLGRIKRQKGGHTSEDGRKSVEWEIVEWTEDSNEEGGMTPSKRKHGVMELEAEDRMDVRS